MTFGNNNPRNGKHKTQGHFFSGAVLMPLAWFRNTLPR
jgi:hypothetical protein